MMQKKEMTSRSLALEDPSAMDGQRQADTGLYQQDYP